MSTIDHYNSIPYHTGQACYRNRGGPIEPVFAAVKAAMQPTVNPAKCRKLPSVWSSVWPWKKTLLRCTDW